MIKKVLGIAMVLMVSGCAINAGKKEVVSLQNSEATSVTSANEEETKRSEREINAIALCGMGYSMQDGVYTPLIVSDAKKDGVITRHEEYMISLYEKCYERMMMAIDSDK